MSPQMLGVVALTVVTGFVLPSVADAGSVACGNVDTAIVSHVRAHGVSCSTARRFAAGYVRVGSCYRGACVYRGFRCTRRVDGYESYRASCRRGSARIRFMYGA